MTTRPCRACGGTGEQIPSPCPTCAGEGRVRARRTITVDVPAGIEDGMRIRLTGQGEVGPGGGPAGDLYIEVTELPHEVFTREGADLHCTVAVPMTAAALGTDLVLTTLDAEEKLEIRPGTQSGAGAHPARQGRAAAAQLVARRPARPRRGAHADQARRRAGAAAARVRRAAQRGGVGRHSRSGLFAKMRDALGPMSRDDAAAVPGRPTLPAAATLVVLDGDEARHAGTVKRLRVGEQVLVGDGRGARADAARSRDGAPRPGRVCASSSRRCVEPRPTRGWSSCRRCRRASGPSSRSSCSPSSASTRSCRGRPRARSARGTASGPPRRASTLAAHRPRGDQAEPPGLDAGRRRLADDRRRSPPGSRAADDRRWCCTRTPPTGHRLGRRLARDRASVVAGRRPRGRHQPGRAWPPSRPPGPRPSGWGTTVLRTSTAGAAALAALNLRLGRWAVGSLACRSMPTDCLFCQIVAGEIPADAAARGRRHADLPRHRPAGARPTCWSIPKQHLRDIGELGGDPAARGGRAGRDPGSSTENGDHRLPHRLQHRRRGRARASSTSTRTCLPGRPDGLATGRCAGRLRQSRPDCRAESRTCRIPTSRSRTGRIRHPAASPPTDRRPG